MALTREALLGFFVDDLAIETEDLADTTPLYSAGIIDSFMLVSLISFLEKQGGYRIETADVTLDNLDTIERILAYAKRMTG